MDAIAARNALNGTEINGSIIRIGYAKIPEMLSPRSSFSTQGGLTPSGREHAPNWGAQSTGALSATSPQIFNNDREMAFQLASISQPNGTSGRWPSISTDSVLSPRDQLLSAGVPLPPPPMNTAAIAGTAPGKYETKIPPIPEPKTHRKLTQEKLKEMKRKFENPVTTEEFNVMFEECLDEVVDLCTDYIGNVVVQKLIEKGTDDQKTLLISKVAPHMAAIGIHKNGTWVVQKMIDTANTSEQVKKKVIFLVFLSFLSISHFF